MLFRVLSRTARTITRRIERSPVPKSSAASRPWLARPARGKTVETIGLRAEVQSGGQSDLALYDRSERQRAAQVVHWQARTIICGVQRMQYRGGKSSSLRCVPPCMSRKHEVGVSRPHPNDAASKPSTRQKVCRGKTQIGAADASPCCAPPRRRNGPRGNDRSGCRRLMSPLRRASTLPQGPSSGSSGQQNSLRQLT